MNRQSFSALTSVVAASLLLASVTPATRAETVGLELALLVDVSGSVDTTEFNLQKQGYVNAFHSAAVQAAIAGSEGGGKIAVTLMYWSDSGQQMQAVPWTVVTAATADAFADAINATVRPFAGNTSPGSAIAAITGQTASASITTFDENGIDSIRQVIDVSGDGAQNQGPIAAAAARDYAVNVAGVDQVNGVVILGEAGLEAWYNANIKSAGGFVLTASDFNDFSQAIERKIVAEVSNEAPGAPLPGIAVAGMSLMSGLGLTRSARRRQTA